jgi:hypothetical protein
MPTPILYWDMETLDGAGRMVDLAGAHHGTISTDVTKIAGKWGAARRFDGAINFRTIAASATGTVNSVTDCTISVWVKPSVLTADSYIFSTLDRITEKKGIEVAIMRATHPTNPNQVRFSFGDGSTITDVYGLFAVPLNVWSHIACSWKFTTIISYYILLNNTPYGYVADGPSPPVPGVSSIFARVGGPGAPSAGPGLQGDIDELIIFASSLSSADLTALFDFSSAEYFSQDAARIISNILFAGWDPTRTDGVTPTIQPIYLAPREVRAQEEDLILTYNLPAMERKQGYDYVFSYRSDPVSVDVRIARAHDTSAADSVEAIRRHGLKVREEVKRVLYLYRKAPGYNYDEISPPRDHDLSDRTRRLNRWTIDTELIAYARALPTPISP